MKFRFFSVLLFACMICSTAGAAIDTLSVWSEAMKKNVNVLVVMPDNYNESGTEAYPVIYMLHGYGGNYTSWSGLIDLKDVATRNRVIIVSPGAENSWYWDSPVDPVE